MPRITAFVLFLGVGLNLLSCTKKIDGNTSFNEARKGFQKSSVPINERPLLKNCRAKRQANRSRLRSALLLFGYAPSPWPWENTSILAKLDPCLSECVHQRRFGEVSLCLSRVRAKSHSSRTTLALSSSRERRSHSSMLSSLSAGTFECGRPQIVFERGRYKIVIKPKLCVSQ